MKKLFLATGFALQGLAHSLRHEFAVQVEAVVLAVLLPVVYFLSVPKIEKLWLVGAWVLVLLCELGNTALEALADRVSTEIHPLTKVAKDVGAAMVFVAVLHAVAVWGIILLIP